jgi:RNA polymerase sigma factor (sigma-70 family)
MNPHRKESTVIDEPSSRKDWAELMSNVAKNGDRSSYTLLFEHFAPLVKAFAMSKYASQTEADEVVQEVMLKVWNKAAGYNPSKAAVSTWIYTIARNTRIDILRRQQKQANDICADDVWLEDENADPFAEVQLKRSQRTIHRTLSFLPPDQKLVMQKAYMEGKSHVEIARELELPLGTVKGRIRLALKKMQILLG